MDKTIELPASITPTATPAPEWFENDSYELPTESENCGEDDTYEDEEIGNLGFV